MAVIECRKSKGIASSQILYKSLLQSGEQAVYVTHFLGQKSSKNTIKETLKQIKKVSVVILYVRSDAKNDVEEIEQLANQIKKHSSLILCYHKTGSLFSSALISYANAIFACFNKDKENAQALCNLIHGNASPYARVNISATEPFSYEYMSEGNASGNFEFMGFGLSFINYSFTNVSLSRYTAKIGEITEVQVTITNNSNYNSYEMPQLYVTPKQNYSPQLIDCGKVSVREGENVTVLFNIDTGKLDYSSFEDNELYEFYACVGKSSTDVVRIPFRVIF